MEFLYYYVANYWIIFAFVYLDLKHVKLCYLDLKYVNFGLLLFLYSEMHRHCVKRKYVWLREENPFEDRGFYRYVKPPKFNTHQKENEALDIHTKKAALKASSSVVALLSYSGILLSNRQPISFIISTHWRNHCFI